MNDKTIYFDMDGTLNLFYEVENWLDYLIDKNPYPYFVASPLLNFSALARILHRLQTYGYKIGIISWLAKDSDDEYDILVEDAKRYWLKKHLPSVKFDEIHILEYGTPKYEFIKNEYSILFDDDEKNRSAWEENGGTAYNEKEILKILKSLLDKPIEE